MDQVAGELSVAPAMCRCQKHRRHSLAHTHTHTPPTSNPQIHKHGYRGEGAPHLQPPPNLMCFHLTLLIHSTHAHTHMDPHAQVYGQTQVNIGFIQACMKNRHTNTHAHMVCSLHLPHSGGAPTCPQISVQGVFWRRKYIINTLDFCN